jgi:hypothetical protein
MTKIAGSEAWIRGSGSVLKCHRSATLGIMFSFETLRKKNEFHRPESQGPEVRAPPGAASSPPARHRAPGSAGWPPPADRPHGRYLPQPAGSPGSRPGWAAPPAAPAGTAGPAGRRSTGVSVSLSERCYLGKIKKKKK